jgi:acyl carrier protein
LIGKDATETEIRARVRALVLAAAPVKAGPAADGAARLVGDLGYDSLGREELVALLEDEFTGLRVPETAFDIETVADVEDVVVRLLRPARSREAKAT